MALKKGAPGSAYRRKNRRKWCSCFCLALFLAVILLIPLIEMARKVNYGQPVQDEYSRPDERSMNPLPLSAERVDSSFDSSKKVQNESWRVRQAAQLLTPFFRKKVIDAISAYTNDLGPLSLDSLKSNLSASWTDMGDESSDNMFSQLDVVQETPDIQKEGQEDEQVQGSGCDLINGTCDSPETQFRRQQRWKRREERAADLMKQDDELIAKLENAVIKRSESFEATPVGNFNENPDNEKAGSTARLIRDQITMARVYLSIAKLKNRNDLFEELQNSLNRLKESERAEGTASTSEKIRAMSDVLIQARQDLYDCKIVIWKLTAMVQSLDEQVKWSKKQGVFQSQVAAKTMPKGIHCLTMHLTIDYYLLPEEERKFSGSSNLVNPDLYHYALFSDNVLAASVAVNSTIMNAKEPEKHVFHIVTDNLNFGAMNMWFLKNPPGKATIHIDNIDSFKWLNSSYCPVLRQQESAAMKEYYFTADHPTSLGSGQSNINFKNPKYLSILNHLRFYLPQMYPELGKILFLDDDVVVQKDLTPLWSVNLKGKVNGAVETCGKSFHRFDQYLNFSDPRIAGNFNPKACGWAYGMNIFDLKEWKKRDITAIYHKWQNMNENRTLWQLGTLPPGLLTFYGLTHVLDKSWHVLALGYNPSVHKSVIERAAVIHFNGNMKPWLETAMDQYKGYWTRYIKLDDPYLRKCKLTN